MWERWLEERIGKTGTQSVIADCEIEMSVPHQTSARMLPVMPTGQLLALVEAVAYDLVNDGMPGEYRTVGSVIDLVHVAPTPSGQRVTAQVTLSRVEGTRCDFDVIVSDEVEQVASGHYSSHIVSIDRFLEKVNKKSGRVSVA